MNNYAMMSLNPSAALLSASLNGAGYNGADFNGAAFPRVTTGTLLMAAGLNPAGLNTTGLSPQISVAGPPLSLLPTAEDLLSCQNKIFVGGLSQQTNSDSLRNYFSTWGEIKECFIKTDPETTRSRGFAFVTFADPLSAKQVLAGGPYNLDGKVLDCKPALPHHLTKVAPLNAAAKKIFVGGLPSNAREIDLKTHFSRFGSIESCMVMMDSATNRSRGFGFVTFSSPDEADNVCRIKTHLILDKQVECRKSLPKHMLNRNGNEASNGSNGRNSNSGSNGSSPSLPLTMMPTPMQTPTYQAAPMSNALLTPNPSIPGFPSYGGSPINGYPINAYRTVNHVPSYTSYTALGNTMGLSAGHMPATCTAYYLPPASPIPLNTQPGLLGPMPSSNFGGPEMHEMQ